MLNPVDTRTWLDMLFRPGDVFEARVKAPDEKGAEQFWVAFEDAERFIQVHIPIHTRNHKHIWVGVAPRVAPDDATPKLHRALWCDFEAGVTNAEQVAKAVTEAGLPTPSMVVNSGNGMHAYWQLDKEYSPEEVTPASRAVHSVLPTDVTYDSSRVMRVPGTLNPKGGTPRPSSIVEYDPELVYPLSAFPRLAASTAPTSSGAGQRISVPLTDEDRALFVANWVDGKKHHMALAVAGYLRKSLYYDRDACLDEIRRLHEAAGYSWEEDGEHLTTVVDDTYRQMFAKVAGVNKLLELGVEPGVKHGVTYSFKRKTPKRIELIDFTRPQHEQEFWLEGLVGPGLTTMWAAEPKVGKSFAVMQLGHALAFGHDIWGFANPGVPKRVLYFQGELSQGMVYQRAKSLFGLDALKDVKRFGLTDKPEETLSLIEHPEALMDVAEHYDVIIVDPIGVFNGNDENSTVSVKETLSVFDRLKRAGKAVVLVHHTKKLATDAHGNSVIPGFSDLRGSSFWFSAADAIALQYRLKDSGNVRVKFTFRAAPERDELTLYRLAHGGFTDDRELYLSQLPKGLKFDVTNVAVN